METNCLEKKTETFQGGFIPLLDEPTNEKVNPLKYNTDLKESRGEYKIYCGCPCPTISAPIWAAGAVVFDPLD